MQDYRGNLKERQLHSTKSIKDLVNHQEFPKKATYSWMMSRLIWSLQSSKNILWQGICISKLEVRHILTRLQKLMSHTRKWRWYNNWLKLLLESPWIIIHPLIKNNDRWEVICWHGIPCLKIYQWPNVSFGSKSKPFLLNNKIFNNDPIVSTLIRTQNFYLFTKRFNFLIGVIYLC